MILQISYKSKIELIYLYYKKEVSNYKKKYYFNYAMYMCIYFY